MRGTAPRSVIKRSLVVGAISAVAGTLTIFGGFFLALRLAETFSGARLPNDTITGIWQASHWAAISAIGGFLFSWFAFGFFIAYSRLSSRS